MTLSDYVPALVTLLLAAASLWLLDRVLQRRGRVSEFARHVTLLVLTAAALLLVVLLLPDALADDQSVLQLFGLAVTLVITLASTTLVANAMAGLMLRSVRSFRPGDFIRVEGHFGRVSERGLFHVEIQTEKRDLTTVPNQFLVTRPVTVTRASGTVVSTELSLGYDAAHQHVEPLLIEAAGKSGLRDPFVQVMELGDSAITYRISGFLDDVRDLFTSGSRLRRRVLETLHASKIEVASPQLIAHRGMSEEVFVVPVDDGSTRRRRPDYELATPQELIFDKAEQAALADRVESELDRLGGEAKELEQQAKKADDDERPALEARLAEIGRRVAELDSKLASPPSEGE